MSRYTWMKDIGLVLFTIQDLHSVVMEEIRHSLNTNNILNFYNTTIYNKISSIFAPYSIYFIPYNEVINGPNHSKLLQQIYCSLIPSPHNNNDNNKCFIQFPVFLSNLSIKKLSNLNLYSLSSPNNQNQNQNKSPNDIIINVQYYHYVVSDCQYHVTSSIVFSSITSICGLSEYNIVITNNAYKNNGKVHRYKIETVAIIELKKSSGYHFDITSFQQYYKCNNNNNNINVITLLSMNIYKNQNKVKHFERLLDEMNRHISNNINAKHSKYHAKHYKIQNGEIDWCLTKMDVNNGWNINNYVKKWNNSDKKQFKNNVFKYKNRFNNNDNDDDIQTISNHSNINYRNTINNNNNNNNNINAYNAYNEYEYSSSSDDFNDFNDNKQPPHLHHHVHHQQAQQHDIQSMASSDFRSNIIEFKDDNPSDTPPPKAKAKANITCTPTASYKSNNNNNIVNDTFQPGLIIEGIKENINTNDILLDIDYRGYVIQSPTNQDHLAVIIDYNNNKNEYKISDYNDKLIWCSLKYSNILLAKNALLKNDVPDIKLLNVLTKLQLIHWAIAIKNKAIDEI